MSAELLAQHLILPLITTAHLAFYSPDPVSELSEADLEKVGDVICPRLMTLSTDTPFRPWIKSAAPPAGRLTPISNMLSRNLVWRPP